MKKILLIFTLSIFVLSCQKREEPKDTIKEYLKTVLNDPESLVIYNINILEDEGPGGVMVVDVEYGAKNILGGMVRTSGYFKIYNGVLVDPLEKSAYEIEVQKKKLDKEISDSIDSIIQAQDDSLKKAENDSKPIFMKKY